MNKAKNRAGGSGGTGGTRGEGGRGGARTDSSDEERVGPGRGEEQGARAPTERERREGNEGREGHEGKDPRDERGGRARACWDPDYHQGQLPETD